MVRVVQIVSPQIHVHSNWWQKDNVHSNSDQGYKGLHLYPLLAVTVKEEEDEELEEEELEIELENKLGMETEMERNDSSSDEEWNEEFEEFCHKVITETKYGQAQWQHQQSEMAQSNVVVSCETQQSAAAALFATAGAISNSIQAAPTAALQTPAVEYGQTSVAWIATFILRYPICSLLLKLAIQKSGKKQKDGIPKAFDHLKKKSLRLNLSARIGRLSISAMFFDW